MGIRYGQQAHLYITAAIFVIKSYLNPNIIQIKYILCLIWYQGNNDHFPKNVYWPPYIKRLAEMFLDTGFFTQTQHDQFLHTGCNFIDVDGVSAVIIYLC